MHLKTLIISLFIPLILTSCSNTVAEPSHSNVAESSQVWVGAKANGFSEEVKENNAVQQKSSSTQVIDISSEPNFKQSIDSIEDSLPDNQKELFIEGLESLFVKALFTVQFDFKDMQSFLNTNFAKNELAGKTGIEIINKWTIR
ncbi:DUF6694 family lipoprotein [Photobacterium angustum]|uniref:Lipoprotein n=1 Tax=Photobacterium angustum TaxID=661 RepID=A0A855S9N2_PHOAN|nr:DUF6694 family lipoprotein [Photobacterium angustum]KJF81712.1 hypothetical protein UB36_10035 [Photobacterium damselae subsp. damselae]KJG36612.1 hypothetical protein UA35_18830 [Photobacterium angustum]KJG45386.1 hypothetical protein UA31_10040 [Photobacterium angustum]KJG46073.1 hypothetical protein UA30_18685 [Photobacterium angustum]KJG52726.1 hypothetical protein UA34_11385 [Photobacterium angustum]